MTTKDRAGWVHEQCTHCVERGAGYDYGKHLGRKGPFLHCLRCGYSERTKGGGARNWNRDVDSPGLIHPSRIAFSVPPPTFIIPTDRGTPYALGLSKLWNWKLSVEEVDPYVSYYTPDSVVFNIRSLDGRTGTFERYFGRDKKCKQTGELGWCIPGSSGALLENVIFVEGVADAISASDSMTTSGLALMGTGNSKLSPLFLPTLSGHRITLLMDGDLPGRRATREIGRWLLRLRMPFSVGTCPEGTDPASLGRDGVNRILESRREVKRIGELISVESTPCQTILL